MSTPLEGESPSDPNTRFSVTYDFENVALYLDGELVESVQWKEIVLIAIRIEDEFLPSPYWYVGSNASLLRIPSNANGSEELFFHGFKEHIPGFDDDATYKTIIEASSALEGSYIVWRQPTAEA